MEKMDDSGVLAEPGNDSGQTKSRKPRKRMKCLYSKIKEQMEFYFSDANLHMSKYMKDTIAETTDGYVELSLFLTFNKIKTLTQDISVIAAALDGKSQLLEVNEGKTHVKRIIPFKDPVDMDERTVYVECLPQHVDHDWVKKLFSACGRVSYISLPKYPSTGDLKGFGFVTFDTVEQAEMACKELHNPPADASSPTGMFPKTRHQLDALKKKLPEEQIKATEEKAKELLQSGVSIDSDAEGDGEDKTKVEITEDDDNESKSPTKSFNCKRSRILSESSVDGSVANSDSIQTPTKRRKIDSNESSDALKSVVKGEKSTPQGKKKSRKRKSQSKSTEGPGIEGEIKTAEDADVDRNCEAVPPSKVRKVEENLTTDGEDAEKMEEAKQNEQVKESANKKKRHRRKKTKKEKEVPELKVIPKKEWLSLRQEYLRLQKTSMALMKKTLGVRQNQENLKENLMKTEKKDEKVKTKELEFVPDVIVKVSSQDPMTRKNLKECLGEKHNIAYFDIKDEHLEGFIRCEDNETASAISTTAIPGYTFSLLTGEAEKQYWEKAITDRQNKLQGGSKSRSKKRGHKKWMDKAQSASIENANRKHIVFDDD